MWKEPLYKRVVLKLSGEALAGEAGHGINQDVLNGIAAQVQELRDLGVDVLIVVGGGNIWRGIAGSKKGMDRATADYMGMLATVINCLALQDALENFGIETRVQTAIEMRQIAELYIKRRAEHHLERGRVVIFGAGTGNPFFSTDTAAALRAAELEANIILMAKKVDGVYDADPRTHPDAKRYELLSYMDVLNEELGVMDATAASMCKDNHIPILVFDIQQEGSIKAAVLGEKIGTLVGGESHD